MAPSLTTLPDEEFRRGAEPAAGSLSPAMGDSGRVQAPAPPPPAAEQPRAPQPAPQPATQPAPPQPAPPQPAPQPAPQPPPPYPTYPQYPTYPPYPPPSAFPPAPPVPEPAVDEEELPEEEFETPLEELIEEEAAPEPEPEPEPTSEEPEEPEEPEEREEFEEPEEFEDLDEFHEEELEPDTEEELPAAPPPPWIPEMQPSAPAGDARGREHDDHGSAELLGYLSGLAQSLPEKKRAEYMNSEARLKLEYLRSRLAGKPGLKHDVERFAPPAPPSVALTLKRLTDTLTYIGKMSGYHPDAAIGSALKGQV